MITEGIYAPCNVCNQKGKYERWRDGLCIAHVIFFFKLGFTPCKDEHTATTRHGVTRKRSTKRLEHTGNV